MMKRTNTVPIMHIVINVTLLIAKARSDSNSPSEMYPKYMTTKITARLNRNTNIVNNPSSIILSSNDYDIHRLAIS